MEVVPYLLGAAVALVAIWLIAPRIMPANMITCTRCDGSGTVDERWPDPTKQGGWHVVNGECPKCQGNGRVRA